MENSNGSLVSTYEIIDNVFISKVVLLKVNLEEHEFLTLVKGLTW